MYYSPKEKPQNSYGLIYEAYCLINNKRYIGQTIQKLNARISLHKSKSKNKKVNSAISNAIRKYGINNFKWKIIGYCDNQKELNNAEKECIKFFKTNDKRYGYNLLNGYNIEEYKFNHNNDFKHKMSELYSAENHHGWLDLNENKIIRYRKSGLSNLKISKIIGCSRRAIENRLKKHNLHTKEALKNIRKNNPKVEQYKRPKNLKYKRKENEKY